MAKGSYYSDEEAEEILRLAVGRSTVAGGVSRESLMLSASELGISPEALAEAEQLVLEKREEEADRAEFRQVQRRKFKKDLWEYVSINAVLMAINWFTTHSLNWSLAVLFFWGIGMFFTMIQCLVPSSSGYQEEYEKWKRKKQKAVQKAVPSQNELLDRLVLENDRLGKIEAIRLVREQTGMDLRESKEAVERYLEQRPDAFA